MKYYTEVHLHWFVFLKFDFHVILLKKIGFKRYRYRVIVKCMYRMYYLIFTIHFTNFKKLK